MYNVINIPRLVLEPKLTGAPPLSPPQVLPHAVLHLIIQAEETLDHRPGHSWF